MLSTPNYSKNLVVLQKVSHICIMLVCHITPLCMPKLQTSAINTVRVYTVLSSGVLLCRFPTRILGQPSTRVFVSQLYVNFICCHGMNLPANFMSLMQAQVHIIFNDVILKTSEEIFRTIPS